MNFDVKKTSKSIIINLKINNSIVGYINIDVIYKPNLYMLTNNFDITSYFYLSEIFVHPNHRRKGYGIKLMDKMLEILEHQKQSYGIYNIVLIPDPFEHNISMTCLKEFYDSFGFEEIIDNIMIKTIY